MLTRTSWRERSAEKALKTVSHAETGRSIDRGVRFVADAQASVFCTVEESYGHRTHSIVVGAVYRAAVRDSVHPLLYQDGRYTVGLADGVDWVIPIGH